MINSEKCPKYFVRCILRPFSGACRIDQRPTFIQSMDTNCSCSENSIDRECLVLDNYFELIRPLLFVTLNKIRLNLLLKSRIELMNTMKVDARYIRGFNTIFGLKFQKRLLNKKKYLKKAGM